MTIPKAMSLDDKWLDEYWLYKQTFPDTKLTREEFYGRADASLIAQLQHLKAALLKWADEQRVDELEKLIDKTDDEWPDKFNWYVKWGEIKDRIATLTGGEE